MTKLFDKHEYVAYPSTVVNFSYELKKIVNDYQNKKLSNAEITEIIKFYAETQPEKLFTNNEFNVTVRRLVGKKRLDVVDTLLKNSN